MLSMGWRNECACLLRRPGSGSCDAELVPPDAMPDGRHVLRDQTLTEIAYAPDWSRVLIAGWKKAPRSRLHYDCYIWQTALIYAGMNAIVRGEKAVLAHCAVLETPRGAVLLFGESGMGKSTASARWRAHGGRCVSDDMALLDFSAPDGVVRVRRIPKDAQRHATKERKVLAYNTFEMLFRVWREDGHWIGVDVFCFAFIYMTLESTIS